MNELNVRLIFEILRRPSEHVKEALNKLVVKMGSDSGIEIIEKKYHAPKEVEEAKGVYTSFAEFEMIVDSLDAFFEIIFNYFPANVEITSPRNLKIGNEYLNEISNRLISRLHHYDAVTKRLLEERQIFLKKLEEMGIKFVPHKEGEQKKENVKKGSDKKIKSKKSGKKVSKKKAVEKKSSYK